MPSLKETYEAREYPACPSCGSSANVAAFVRGKPTEELSNYAHEEGSRVILGGCTKSIDNLPHHCRACKKDF
eukprot:NODE_5558_length_401_cov_36.187500_g4865_i0.p3 GENE.NODE_5558_length_401_cov_36.187500_g4865_i0~~NODE_5558_length_401_cov_36.187500_g4865_i0.p3  ORF type:complete len:72 (-),score=13.15 NODE_5558_length_401_cov_36.187500_g4865_i0:116-331(-)